MSTESDLHNLVEQLDITKDAKQTLHDKIRKIDPLVPSEVEALKAEITGQNPRAVSEAVTDEKLENQHLGKHTPETLQQEVISLGNINKMFRNSKWVKRADNIKAVCRSQMKENPRFYQGLLDKINSIIQGEL